MLSLDDSRWSTLTHAYGSAANIPPLLRQLESLPSAEGESEPWYYLWSALAHQGDVYSASFAAVPHVVNALSLAPSEADSTYFQFPAWVEICRLKNGVDVPEELRSAYFSALEKIPALIASASKREWDEGLLVCALSALAASKGFAAIGEAVLELNSEMTEDFMEWVSSR